MAVPGTDLGKVIWAEHQQMIVAGRSCRASSAPRWLKSAPLCPFRSAPMYLGAKSNEDCLDS
jgi:hypothetical protein